MLCKIVAIDEKEDDLNVYKLYKMEESSEQDL